MGGFQRGEERLWIRSETLRQKVQVQRAVDAETSGKRDGRRARGLIEKMEMQRRYLVENLPGRLVPHTADQRFPGDDFARDRVDDGLKGEAEGRFGWNVRLGAHCAPASWIGDDIGTMAHRADQTRFRGSMAMVSPRLCTGLLPKRARVNPLKVGEAWKPVAGSL